MRRSRIAALAIVPVLMASAAACGSSGSGSKTSDSGSPSVGALPKVSTNFGKAPTVTIPKNSKPSKKMVVKTIKQGTGATIKTNDFVNLDYDVTLWRNGKTLEDTYKGQQPQTFQAGSANVLKAMSKGVIGKKAGSRIEVVAPPADAFGTSGNKQAGVKGTDTLVFVMDVHKSTTVKDFDKALAGKQAKAAKGMPTVKQPASKAATITIPKGAKAPSKLEQQTLIQGKGATVKKGDTVIAQYTGVVWKTGKEFDDSFKHGGATPFVVGKNQVIKGWDQGLVGKKVGSRVLLVIPPSLGYGSSAYDGIPKNSTLVFSVDILGTM